MGEMVTVGAYEAKTQLSALLDKVEQGEEVVITRHGKPVARLVKAETASREQIDAAIASAGWVSSAATARGAAPQRGEGSKPGERPAALSTMALPEIVERFIHVDDSTGEFAFDLWTQEMVKRSKIVAMLPARVRWDGRWVAASIRNISSRGLMLRTGTPPPATCSTMGCCSPRNAA